MTTSYPGGLDSFTNPTGSDQLSTSVGGRVHSAMHADINDCIEAIEAELGTDPSGSSFSTVKARIAAAETATYVSLALSANQSANNGVVTNVNWNSEIEDTLAFHDLVTNTDRATVPSGQAGIYVVTACVAFDANATGVRALNVNVNGTKILDFTLPNNGAGTTVVLTAGRAIRLAVADYVTVSGWQNSGGALNMRSAESFLSMTRVGI